ncbi:MAG: hypothetical protein Q9166_007305 [cf. Caloplaca sp. 2 TL-2023]
MAESSSLVSLLSGSEEPTEARYRQVSGQIVNSPQALLDPIDDTSNLLYCLINHGHRFVQLFRRISPASDRRQCSFQSYDLTCAISTLLTHIISVLHNTNEDLLVTVISPALEACLTSGARQTRELAATLLQNDSIVKRLVINNVGQRAISSWIHSPVACQQDAATLQAWTDKLASLVQLCATDHHLSEELRRWEDLKRLIGSLKQLNSEANAQQSSRTQRGTNSPQFTISAEESNLLRQFNFTVPESLRKLLEAIESLEIGETIATLQALVATFPCNLCKETLRRGMRIAHDDTKAAEFHVDPLTRFGMHVFGRKVGDWNWEVLLSTPALSDLVNRTNWRISAIIMDKLSALARGNGITAAFAGSSLARQHLKVPLFITQCDTNVFIVWQIDVDLPYETSTASQVIRVWDIVPARDIDRLLEHVSVIQSTWTVEMINRCRQGSLSNAKERLPRTYHAGTGEGVVDFRKHIKLDVRSKDQYFYNLIGKYFPFTESFFRPRDDSHVPLEFPYKLSPYETEIVCHRDAPSIILGRSGTGKTTCLVYKMIGRHIASKELNEEQPLRQVLLTRSFPLAEKIRYDIRRTLETLLPGSTKGADTRGLVTRGSTEHSFLNPPNTLYPYVCTFEEFLQRLENTVAVVDVSEIQQGPSNRLQQEAGRPDSDNQPEPRETRKDCVDFPKFKEDYWPTLSRDNDRKLPISLIFAEIMGVIKGSATSAHTSGSLSCDEYLQQSSRIAPAFAAKADRAALYKLFKKYESLKLDRKEVDYADRVLQVLKALRKVPVLKRILAAALDEVYIDEVQDQRSVDLELLLGLVNDSRCFHVAGDTAQAISQESSFRFEDLKAMIHRHFMHNRSANKEKLRRPRMFRLGLNYRSHDGIVKLGSFVMDLLWKTFPETVDKLPPEEGLLPGPTPILFVGCESDILTKVNDDGSGPSAGNAKFGAEQVVLVRDEDSKARLKDFIGNIALILTIRQSKGMEFDDVVLFDFFTSSPESDGWRSLSDALGNEPRAFDSRRYVATCTELKHLYVAVTRARNKFFMIETASQDILSPVIQLLTQRTPASIIQLIGRGDFEFDQNLQLLRPDRLTDPKRWIERGSNLLSDAQYREALHCFEQADYKQGIKLVQAKIQQAKGSACLARNDRLGATKAFEASMYLYLEIHKTDDAVRICCQMGWLERAAGLRVEQQQYEKAATLFNDAKLYIRAAECYQNAQMYNQAAEVLWIGKEFDELVHYLVNKRDLIPAPVFHKHVSLCKIPLKQNKLSVDHRKEVILLLGSSKEREELLFRYEIHDALEELFLEERRFDDLFSLRLQLGNLEAALELALHRNKAKRSLGTADQIRQLIDWTVIGRITENARRRKPVSSKLLNDLKKLDTREQQQRIKQWDIVIGCLKNDDQSPAAKLGEVKDELMKLVIALQLLDADSLRKTPSFEALLLNKRQQAVTVVMKILIGDVAQVSESILAVCGIWKPENSHRPCVIQEWSPLSDELCLTASGELISTARTWIMVKFSESIAALHDISNHLWKSASPPRCAQFLNKGRQDGTRFVINAYSNQDFAPATRIVNGSISMLPQKSVQQRRSLTWLYNRRVMDENFQVSFLRMRRSWQERLVREITWISAFEQDAVANDDLLVRIRYHKAFSHVASGIEALLLYRLRREWTMRSGFSSLVEQMQLATALGMLRFLSRHPCCPTTLIFFRWRCYLQYVSDMLYA